MKHGKNNMFTLIEVVVALGILGLGVVGALTLLTGARDRSIKASNRWKQQHMLSQAVEYLMLTPREGERVPERFFPYKDFSISYSFDEPEQLPDDATSTVGAWQLVTMQVKLINNHGGAELTLSIDRIIKSDAANQQ